jgi:predicted amidohydrolase
MVSRGVSCALSVLWILLAIVPLATAERAGNHDWTDPQRYRLPRITEIAFSPDGTHIAAAFLLPAINRPGTDWSTWVAIWDLQSGDPPQVIDWAASPIAFQGDGTALVAALHDSDRRAHFGPKPAETLAIWTVGETEPRSVLHFDENENDHVIALTVHPNGEDIFALSAAGRLIHWSFQPNANAERVSTLGDDARDRINIARAPLRQDLLLFSGDGTRLIALLGDSTRPPGDRNDPVGFFWRLRPSSMECELAGTFEKADLLQAAPPQRLIRVLRSPERGFTIPEHWGYGEAVCGRPSWSHRQLTVASHGRRSAISIDGRLAVRDRSHKPTFVIPAAVGACAFSPDAARIAVPDRRGVIGLWNVETGELERSLGPEGTGPPSVRVAAVQVASEFGDIDANRDLLCHRIGGAAFRGAAIVVLPETALTGYLSHDLARTWRVEGRMVAEGLGGVDPAGVAQSILSDSIDEFRELAARFGIYLTVPFVEVDPRTQRYYNTVVLLGPTGEILIHYRKHDPWPRAEQSWATAGNLGHPVVDTPFGRLGCLICYDIHDQAAAMGDLEIDTLLYSVAWVDEANSDFFVERLPDIASEHGFNIVAANWTIPYDAEVDWHGHGGSRVIARDGRVISAAEPSTRERIIYADLPVTMHAEKIGGN